MDLNKCLKEIGQVNGVTGCVLADNKGLCLGVTGKASKESSGIIKAIADQVGKLHPDLPPPAISLESDSKTCLIQHEGNVTAAVYKNISA
ncbi:hypothetical protein R5R35_004292 [Gryllus longicercus]|uniref:Late endosomal/lysosomal adaptor and MAPK and MTOR activator 5 n=1 Tax=Gryllus longicercus TaxID=2509291 RepID=A0AAN9WPW2_9ORTH